MLRIDSKELIMSVMSDLALYIEDYFHSGVSEVMCAAALNIPVEWVYNHYNYLQEVNHEDFGWDDE